MITHIFADVAPRPAPHRVLVIDDDAAILATLQRLIEQAGHVVIDKPNGHVGLAVRRHQPPDIVPTDIFMPEQDGIEVIREVKTTWSESRVIAMTGGSPVDSFESVVNPATLLFGAEQILLKPFDHRTLLSTMKDTLSLNKP